MSNANNKRVPPMKPGQTEPTQEQKEALTRLGGLFKGRQQQPQYAPILKSLETINIEQRIMTVKLDDDLPVECLVIPLQELIFKEWRQMSGSTLQPPREEQESE